MLRFPFLVGLYPGCSVTQFPDLLLPFKIAVACLLKFPAILHLSFPVGIFLLSIIMPTRQLGAYSRSPFGQSKVQGI